MASFISLFQWICFKSSVKWICFHPRQFIYNGSVSIPNGSVSILIYLSVCLFQPNTYIHTINSWVSFNLTSIHIANTRSVSTRSQIIQKFQLKNGKYKYNYIDTITGHFSGSLAIKFLCILIVKE